MTDINRILNLIFDNKPEDALPLLSPLLESEPDNSDAWYALGLIQQKRQDFQWAVESYRKAFTLDQSQADALFNYARLLRGNPNPELQTESRRAFKTAKKLRPELNIPYSVYIGLPHYGHSEPAFEESFDALIANIKPQDNIDWMSCRCEGSRITSNRNRLVADAISKCATHILFIDNDMDFRPDSLHRLLAHNKDIVCATTCKRGDETGTPIGQAAPDDSNEPVKRVSTGSGKLTKMQLVGACFMLINLDVFEKVRLPAFFEPPAYDIGDALGEDITFCNEARKAGFDIWLDVDISFELGHWGKKRYHIKPMGYV